MVCELPVIPAEHEKPLTGNQPQLGLLERSQAADGEPSVVENGDRPEDIPRYEIGAKRLLARLLEEKLQTPLADDVDEIKGAAPLHRKDRAGGKTHRRRHGGDLFKIPFGEIPEGLDASENLDSGFLHPASLKQGV